MTYYYYSPTSTHTRFSLFIIYASMMSQLQTERYKEKKGRAQKETVPRLCAVCAFIETHTKVAPTPRYNRQLDPDCHILSLLVNFDGFGPMMM